MRWDWETFPEYLDSLEKQGLGLNVGSVFPFSPLRAYVLGVQDSRERTSVSDAELDQMKQIFHDAMQAGAFGFSADKNQEDRPEDGSFLPSHVASEREVSRSGRGTGGIWGWSHRLDLVPVRGPRGEPFPDDQDDGGQWPPIARWAGARPGY